MDTKTSRTGRTCDAEVGKDWRTGKIIQVEVGQDSENNNNNWCTQKSTNGNKIQGYKHQQQDTDEVYNNERQEKLWKRLWQREKWWYKKKETTKDWNRRGRKYGWKLAVLQQKTI